MVKNNKPRYTFFKNTSYALNGLKIAFKNETSFKIEMLMAIPIFLAIFFIKVSFIYKLILIVSAFIIAITELLNSAIENVVDLVTTDFHPLAKNAKDIAAAAVFFSISLHIICWIFVLFFV